MSLIKLVCCSCSSSNTADSRLSIGKAAAMVTIVALLAMAACSLAQLGAFAHFAHNASLSFSAIGLAVSLVVGLTVWHFKCSKKQESGIYIECIPGPLTAADAARPHYVYKPS